MTAKVTKSPDEVIFDYVRAVADAMALRDWTIAVSTDPDNEPEDPIHGDVDRCASFSGTLGRKHAGVWISCKYWNEATPEERRQTIVHELLHAHEHGPREVVINALSVHPKRTAEAIQGIYDVQNEYLIDALADVMAPLFPLPPDLTLLEPAPESAPA